jgi:hypothetical protein
MPWSIARVSSGPRTDIDLESTVTRLTLRSASYQQGVMRRSRYRRWWSEVANANSSDAGARKPTRPMVETEIALYALQFSPALLG